MTVIGKKNKIVAVTQIIPAFKSMFDKLIQAVQINIGKELTVEIADGKPFTRLCLEKGFVRRQAFGKFYIAAHNRVDGAIMKNKQLTEPQCLLIRAFLQTREISGRNGVLDFNVAF